MQHICIKAQQIINLQSISILCFSPLYPWRRASILPDRPRSLPSYCLSEADLKKGTSRLRIFLGTSGDRIDPFHRDHSGLSKGEMIRRLRSLKCTRKPCQWVWWPEMFKIPHVLFLPSADRSKYQPGLNFSAKINQRTLVQSKLPCRQNGSSSPDKDGDGRHGIAGEQRVTKHQKRCISKHQLSRGQMLCCHYEPFPAGLYNWCILGL